MNTVWILEEGAYDQRVITGAYGTAEAGKAARPKKQWVPDESGWYYSGQDLDDVGYLYPMEVQE